MATSLRIVGLGGSMARNSRSRAALQTALEGAASAGPQTQLLDIRRLDLPRTRSLGGEVVRVAERFASGDSIDREDECAQAAERVGASG
jgi:NAD(P)H-dependent FMN reductase